MIDQVFRLMGNRRAFALSVGAAMLSVGAPVLAQSSGIGLIEIEDTLTERSSSLASIFGITDKPTLRGMVGIIDDAAADAELQGLVIRLRDASLSATQVEELGNAIKRCRDAGKKVHLFADSYATSELLLGSFCTMPGMYMEEMYMADTFNWVGIKPDFVQVGDYKGASEPMARSGPSPEWEQNINQLLDGLYGNTREHIKAGRKLDDAKLDRAMEQAIMANGEIAKSAGLIDTVIDLPELSTHLEKAYGGELDWTNLTEEESKGAMDLQNPFTLITKLLKPQSHKPKRDTIAVLHIDGPIVDGDSSAGGFMGSSAVGSATIRRSLSDLEEDGRVKGVIVRVNSPGGSAIASESMWLGVKRLSAKKPVWVSIGSMAASGGYYVAVSGGRIFVDPSSIVGSIGVVGGKLALGGLYEKIHLNVVPRSRGPMAGLLGSKTPWTDAERSLIRTRMTETYQLFTRRVTAGRAGIDLSKTAEGRLFVGKAAIDNKMADEVGGITEAIAALADKVGLQDGKYDVLDYPPAPGLGEMLEGMMGSMVTAPGVGASGGDHMLAGLSSLLREIVGERAWPAVRDQICAMLELRNERVLLVSPKVLIFK